MPRRRLSPRQAGRLDAYRNIEAMLDADLRALTARAERWLPCDPAGYGFRAAADMVQDLRERLRGCVVGILGEG